MPNDALWTAYANTILLIGDEPQIKVDLRQPVCDDLRHLLTKLGLGSVFAIVTPFDPRGVRDPAWKNQRRYEHARALLEVRNLRFTAADGESPDAAHRERGFALAVSRSDAAALARELEQLALYWFDGEAFWIDGALAARAPHRLP
jgi:hypothetical protein